MRSAISAGILACAIATGAAAQPAKSQETIRLVCEGFRESGIVGNMKREPVTIQLKIFLPDGLFNSQNLTLVTQMALPKYVPPRFHVDAEEFYFEAENKRDDIEYYSRFAVDRYTSFAHELQTISHPGSEPHSITGEYKCKRIDTPAF